MNISQWPKTSDYRIYSIFIFIHRLEVNIHTKSHIPGDRIAVRIVLLRIDVCYSQIIPNKQILAADINSKCLYTNL